MRVVIGRGNARKVYEIPCANIINRGDEREVKAISDNICKLLGIR